MAILIKLELCNFAQYAHQVIEFGPGLTILAGPMGSGKSNMIMAAGGSLVNDWTFFPGTKPSLIYREAGPKEHSYVASTWQLLDGTKLRVVRGFRGVKSSLEINGEATKDRLSEDEITARVVAKMNIDPKQVLKHHIVRQSETAAIIEAKDTNRVKYMAQVLGCEHLLSMQDEATTESKQASAKVSDVALVELRTLVRRRRFIRHGLTENANQVQKIKPDLLTDDAKEQLQAMLSQRDRRLKLIASRQTNSGELSRQRANLQQYQETKAKLDAHESKAEELVLQTEAQLEEVKRSVQYSLMSSRIADLQTETSRVIQELEKVPEIPATELPADIDALLQEQRDIYAEAGRHLKVLLTGGTICQTCGTQLNYEGDIGVHKIELVRRQSKASETLAGLESLSQLWHRYRTRKEHYDERRPSLEQRRAELENQVAALVEDRQAKYPQAPAVVEAGVENRLTELLTKYRKAIKDASDIRQKTDQQIGRAEANITTLTASLQQIADELNTLPALNDSNLREAEQQLSQQAELLRVKHDLEIDAARLGGELQRIEEDIAKKVKEIVALKQQRRWACVMEKVAIESRPVNFPKRAMQGTLDKMADPISAVCAHLGLPFRIKTADSLEFVAVHPSGFEESAYCLSGGQKACVAVAFSLAKLIRCNDGLDTLFMDEPAANLDADAVAQLGTFLQSLGRRLAQTGKQVIISTHHQQLKEVGQYSQLLVS